MMIQKLTLFLIKPQLPKDIVIHRGYGGPKVELKGKAATFAKKLNLKHISLSLTDTHHNAAAVATGIFGK